jgi:predicted acetyltransferase
MINYCIAKSKKEWLQAIKLANSIFKDFTKLKKSQNYKADIWLNDPTFRIKNLVLAKDINNNIIGMVRIVPRIIYIHGRAFNVAGFTSICIDPAHRKKGYSIQLINFAIKISNEYGFDFAILFARRALDHYYTNFGFWGVSSYNKAKIKRPLKLSTDNNYTLVKSNHNSISLYKKVYKNTYEHVSGRVKRNNIYWNNIVRRCMATGLNFRIIRYKKKDIGYCIYKKQVIFEIGLLNSKHYTEVINILFQNLRYKTLEFWMSSEHKFFLNKNEFDMELVYRECSWGGHMIRVLDKLKKSNTALSYEETLDYLNIFIGTRGHIDQRDKRSFNICFLDEL